jgi:hypothetical protein
LRNTILDVLLERGWKETDRYVFLPKKEKKRKGRKEKKKVKTKLEKKKLEKKKREIKKEK